MGELVTGPAAVPLETRTKAQTTITNKVATANQLGLRFPLIVKIIGFSGVEDRTFGNPVKATAALYNSPKALVNYGFSGGPRPVTEFIGYPLPDFEQTRSAARLS